MAENGTTKKGEIDLGDLGQIRNILMGQQMSAYEQRFVALEAQILEQSKLLSSRLNELEKSTEKSMEVLDKGSNDNLERLEKLIEKKLEQLNKRLDDTSTKDKAKIGKMFADMSKKLLDS